MTQSKYSILQVRLLLLVLMMILHVLLRLEKAAAIPCRSWRFPSSAAAFGMIPQQQRLPIRHRHFWDHRSPLSSRAFSSLAAENNNGRRPLPPQLDEWNYEDGFGAYDFDGFDEYDIEDMNSEAFVMGDDGMMYPKPKKQSTIDTDDQTMVMEAGQVEEERIVESSLTSTSLFPSVDGNKQDSFDEKAKEDKNRFNGISSEETMSQTTPTSTSSCRQTDEKEEDKTKNVPSREEFRHRGVQTQRHDEEFFKRASLGTGVTTELDRMEDQLEEYKHELIVATNNKKFNPNSPRQISVALYGYTGESTNKDVLEAMAANGNRIADLVIKYRSLNREINKRKKRQENKEKGTYAKSVYTVKRAAKSDPADDSAETEEQLNGMKSSPQQSKSETESGSETKSSKSNPVSVSKDEDPVLLVDASAYIFRA